MKIPPNETGEEVTILPSSEKLVQSVRATLQKWAPSITDAQSRFELTSIDYILSEIVLREHTGFFAQYYADGVTLAEEGLALLDGESTEAVRIAAALAALPRAVDPDWRFEVIARHINKATRCVSHLVAALRRDKSALQWVRRSSAHEDALHQHRMQAPTVTPPPPNTQGKLKATPATLQHYLREKFPERAGLEVKSFRQLVGGYQKTTILFEIEDAAGRQDSLVIRAERPTERFLVYDPGLVVDEFEVVTFLSKTDLPIAEPLWLEADPDRLGQRFFVSRRMPGENFGTAMVATEMPRTVARSFISTMARMHAIPVNDEMRRLPMGRWGDFPTLRDNTRAYVEDWINQPWMVRAEPSPQATRIATWLLDNVPEEDGKFSLLHTDFGPHNILVHEEKVSAILDWEAARIGDPAEDVAWFLQSAQDKISFDQALDWYEEDTGIRFGEFRLRYFDVVGTLKQMQAMLSAGAMFEYLETAAVEWTNFPLRWFTYITPFVESKIEMAEKARK